MDRLFSFLERSVTPGELVGGIVSIGAILLVVVVPVVAGVWYSLRVKQWEMSLKHAMLERGMSADEIKTVLEASAKAKPRTAWWEHCPRTAKEA